MDNIDTNSAVISPGEAKAQLWFRGTLSWKLHVAQLDMYKAYFGCDNLLFVINCTRRIGKTYMLCLLAIEFALKNPRSTIAFIAPTAVMVKKNIAPLMRQILDDCPKSLLPAWKAQDKSYVFKNGSEIQIAGTDNERAELLRGQTIHLVLIDEAREIEKLQYIVTDILIPTTMTTKGRIIMASTPPESYSHDFVTYVDKAKLKGNYIHKNIFDNPMLTAKEKTQFIEEMGGKDSIACRRELFAEIITDPTVAVIPEFTDVKEKEIVKEVPRPDFFDCYDGMDVGFNDNTGVIFGYWDFKEAKLVIEDELLLNRMTTQELANGIKAHETALWKLKAPYLRISDTDLIVISDLSRLHNLNFIPTRKDNKEAAINNLRMLVADNKLIIHPRCKNLISQLHGAIWNKNKTDFIRTNKEGHFDLVSALIYLARNVLRNRNPYPPGLGLDINTMYIHPEATFSDNVIQVRKIFNSDRFFAKDKDDNGNKGEI